MLKTAFKKSVLSFLGLAVLSAILKAQTSPISGEEAHRRAEALLKKMTLDEKVGQLNQSSGVQMPLLGNEKPDELVARAGWDRFCG